MALPLHFWMRYRLVGGERGSGSSRATSRRPSIAVCRAARLVVRWVDTPSDRIPSLPPPHLNVTRHATARDSKRPHHSPPQLALPITSHHQPTYRTLRCSIQPPPQSHPCPHSHSPTNPNAHPGALPPTPTAPPPTRSRPFLAPLRSLLSYVRTLICILPSMRRSTPSTRD